MVLHDLLGEAIAALAQFSTVKSPLAAGPRKSISLRLESMTRVSIVSASPIKKIDLVDDGLASLVTFNAVILISNGPGNQLGLVVRACVHVAPAEHPNPAAGWTEG